MLSSCEHCEEPSGYVQTTNSLLSLATTFIYRTTVVIKGEGKRRFSSTAILLFLYCTKLLVAVTKVLYTFKT
jgi:hypothetical protein